MDLLTKNKAFRAKAIEIKDDIKKQDTKIFEVEKKMKEV